MFKSLESLFSGLALVGVIAAIILQQKELHQNTEALLAQKTEMNNQWKEMENQNTNIKRQRLEATLFSMWNLHFQTRSSLKVSGEIGVLSFKSFVDAVMRHSIEHMKRYNPNAQQDEMYINSLVAGVPLAVKETGFITTVELYVSSLKLIYNSIIQAKLESDALVRYIEVAQSYLTNYEVMFLVLYYNHLLAQGREGSLTDMYKGLGISISFAFRLEESYDLKLIIVPGTSFV